MSTITVAPSPNGTKPRLGRTPGKVVPLLGPSIDHLLELRELIRRAHDGFHRRRPPASRY